MEPPAPKASNPKRKKLRTAALGTGIAAAATYGTAAALRASFNSNPTAAKFHTTNAAYYTSIGLATATVGLAGVAFVVRFD
ncbi:MAG: hypothetical protein JRJ84_24690 [Deltaproteobacteria bacterium]|nr:hypothetical protein [Deltaproteobacteria bacterium]